MGRPKVRSRAPAMEFMRHRINYFAPRWWEEWEMLLESDNMELKKFAMVEFNKLQAKVIPQDLDVKGEVVIQIAKQIADKYEKESE